jgi:small subunit ribosomal protein S2
MAQMSLVKQMIEAGIHFGHRSAGWCPKMEPYIYGKRNGIHIVDVRQTIKGLLLARKFVTRTVAGGKDVLFVGTKRQARPAIEGICEEVGMPYVTERWLGGTLTNFRTIRSRLKRLEELEQLMASEDWANYSKKMASQLTRERRKIHRNLSGIRNMDRLPGAMVVIDVRREVNALHEAQKLGVPTVCLIDTDSDPELADIPIPGNDDAMRAIELVVQQLGEAIKEGKSAQAQQQRASDGPADQASERPHRRSARAMYSASADESAPATEPESTGQTAATETAPADQQTDRAAGTPDTAPPANEPAEPATPTEPAKASEPQASAIEKGQAPT